MNKNTKEIKTVPSDHEPPLQIVNRIAIQGRALVDFQTESYSYVNIFILI
jgi:hypothetical protein